MKRRIGPLCSTERQLLLRGQILDATVAIQTCVIVKPQAVVHHWLYAVAASVNLDLC